MNLNKKWGTVLMAAVLLMAPVSAVQAKTPVPEVMIAQAGDAGQPEGNEERNPQFVPDLPTDAGEPAAEQAGSAPSPNQVAASSAVEETQFRNLAGGLPYEWSEEPDASRPDGEYKLTDGKYGTLDMNDPAWVGHQRGKTREVVFDLGEEKSIGKITAHFFQDYPTNSILVPLTVSMYVSDDKENWGLLSHNATQLLWGKVRQDRRPLNGTAAGMESKVGIRTASLLMPVMSKSPLRCIQHNGHILMRLKFGVPMDRLTGP